MFLFSKPAAPGTDDVDYRLPAATVHDISRAHIKEDNVLTWFQTVWSQNPRPLAAEVWVFSPDFEHVLMVEHRWRGLVPPGGQVEPGETLREAAARELAEETGLHLTLADRPAFAAVRSFRADWLSTLNVSYWATARLDAALEPEANQPARWVRLEHLARTFHPQDEAIMRRFGAERAAAENQ